MEKNPWIGISLIVAVIAAVAYFGGQNLDNSASTSSNTSTAISSDPTMGVKTDTQIKATAVQVGTFYDGEDGYSLAIPGGNYSTCIWEYEGGSARIPYLETTEARTATEKHTIHDLGYSDWAVTCVDDFGNHYVGVFPPK